METFEAGGEGVLLRSKVVVGVAWICVGAVDVLALRAVGVDFLVAEVCGGGVEGEGEARG